IMKRSLAFVAAVLAVSLGADKPEKPVSFRDQVAPILVKHCLGCHNAQKAESGLNMATFALLKKGGKSAGAEILAPGDPDASGLIEMIGPDAEPRMPYKLAPLSDAQIQTLTRWVKEGAKFDAGSEAETQLASLVDPLKDLQRVEVKVPTSDPVTALAFSIDSKWLAAALGRSVILFDSATAKPAATLADHPGPVNAIEFTPDGKTLIAAGGRAGQFGAITLWDVQTHKRLKDMRGHADSILAADLAPDGNLLATGSYDKLIKLWDISKGAEVRTLKEHTDAVYSVQFSPDGKHLASAGGDRTVKLWETATGKRIQSLSEATAEVYAVAFAEGGSLLLAGGVDRSIRAWDVAAAGVTLARTVIAHDAPVVRLVLSPDGKTLYSGGEDRRVKAWEIPSLKPFSAQPAQADWPLALAVRPADKRLVIGEYDGSIVIVDPQAKEASIALREAPKPLEPAAGSSPAQTAKEPPPKPALVRNASLGPPSPRGGMRGSKVRLTLSGTSVGQASVVAFDDPGMKATIVAPEKPDANRLTVDLEIAADVRVGVHRFGVQTPLGFPGLQSFAVSAYPEQSEAEPNDDAAKLKPVTLPATLLGTIEKPGDVDMFLIPAQAGQALVFETTARALGSSLAGVLELADSEGRVVARADSLDPLLTYEAKATGTLALRVLDADYGGSGNHFYRIHAGLTPHLERVYPLGAERGKTATIQVQGANLGGLSSVPFEVPASAQPGSLASVPLVLPDGSRPFRSRNIVVAEGPQSTEAEPNDAADKATALEVPGGASGVIGSAGDVDMFRFSAKKGQRLVIEVFGRRLGTPIDPVIEVLDAEGRSIPRAVLRPVAETFVAFRDHNSSGRNIRLTNWDDFAIGDYVLAGRDLLRLSALPKNPDDDAVFWGNGNTTSGGERLAFLETTAEHHPMGQPLYKVEFHPPGTRFPPGGVPPVTFYYRNDDGGPGFSNDARVTFDPPADGTYLVRVEDARGFGGEAFGYHVLVRAPRPDFSVSIGNENPNIPRGGATIVTATIKRLDGFNSPVEVSAGGLPEGVHATKATIERDMFSAELLLFADSSAPATSDPTWRVLARAVVDPLPGSAAPAGELRHEVDPGGALGGRITVTPEPDIQVAAEPTKVTIRPGERVELKFAVNRKEPFSGRVPIDVRNLPHGVRVLNIGLNGVLITEKQTERAVFLYAEPWVEPMDRPFFASAKLEVIGKPTPGTAAPVIDSSRESVSAPIELIVAPRPAGAQASAAKP
ncbi:MAG TPA: c-type cytochrome domain-containing protein, partial [Isosphaeraceae bacterium]|nr:c-type cytochrome domain-containing protein [Isosphaeraceae bacterium]